MSNLPELNSIDDAPRTDIGQHKWSWPLFGYVLTTVVSLILTPVSRRSDAGVLEGIVIQASSSLIIYGGLFSVCLLLAFISRLVLRTTVSLRFVSIVTILMLLLGTVAQLYVRGSVAQPAAQQVAPPSIQGPAADVITAVSTQSSDGVTEADLDQQGLMRLQDWIVNMTAEKTALVSGDAAFDSAAYTQSLNPQSVYISVAGRKLAVTKLRPPRARIVSIIGIRGNELIRVLCMRDSPEDIVVLSGACGREVSRSFQITLPVN